MQRDELSQTVMRLIAREVDMPVESIGLNSTLEDLGVDSLDVLKLAIAFEQTFNISISTEDLVRIRSVADIIDQLEQKTAAV